MRRCNRKNCGKIAIARSKPYNVGDRHYYCVGCYWRYRKWLRGANKRIIKLGEAIMNGDMDKIVKGEW